MSHPLSDLYSPFPFTLLPSPLLQALHLVTVILGRPSPSGSGNCRLITAASTGETGYHEFPVPQYPSPKPWEVESEGPFWATYLKGVVALMNRTGSIPPFDAIIATSVPLGGGLSSSAALEAATYQFIEQLCPGVQLGSLTEKALLCQAAEHRYARVRCGIMDQFVSLMGKEKHALFIDCRWVPVSISLFAHMCLCAYSCISLSKPFFEDVCLPSQLSSTW